MKHIVLLLLTLLLIACSPAQPPRSEGEPFALRYAELLQMEETDSFCRVEVKNPWQKDRLLATYVLVPAGQKLPQGLPEGTLVRTPLRRTALLSAVHAALWLDLGCGAAVAALADTAYVVSPRVKQLCATGAVPLGSSLSPNLEVLKARRCDAVLVSPFENAGHGALDRLDIPLIECADYLETSPLGRAEWMRFYGRLLGCALRADSLFEAVEKSYEAVRKQVAKDGGKRPKVFCDLLTQSVWYQPGGASTMGRLLTDAGADYLWADRPESGSLALNLEAVYARAREADLWLVKYGAPRSLTYEEMAADCPAYREFRAFREERVFACNTLHVPFYEEVPFHPDLLLRSLSALFHPATAQQAASPFYTPLRHASRD